MADATSPSRSLSEIGHLFLSSVRERQTQGAPRPKRRPPARPAPAARLEVSVELTPEELAEVCGGAAETKRGLPDGGEGQRLPPVTAIISAHLGGKQLDRAKEYARHLAAGGRRIGLIEVDSSEFRVICFEKSAHGTEVGAAAAHVEANESLDPRAMADAIEELSCDLDRWLLLLPSPRTLEARCLLRDVNHWVLLSACDHDGVVGGYRTLKGLHESSHRPRLSLALLDAHGGDEADRVHRKLSGVCRQFLHWSLEAQSPVRPAQDVAEHTMICQCLPRDKAHMAVAPQWQVVAGFLSRAKVQAETRAAEMEMNGVMETHEVPAGPKPEMSHPMATAKVQAAQESGPRAAADMQMPAPVAAEPIVAPIPFPAAQPAMQPAMRFAAEDRETISQVIDLPDAQSGGGGILAAILASEATELIECPLKPPMYTEAKLAVTRDRRIVLLAATRQGLSELRSIGRAYNWLIENYALIAMALPQMAINTSAQPRLRLLVDHADLSAEILQPMLQSSTVTVQAYRRLRWGQKTGLLLDAA